MKTIKILRQLILTTLALGALTACHTARRTATAVPPGTGRDWHDVHMPVKVSMATPARLSLSGRATMVRDSLINISMRVLGFEVAAVNITADSVWMVDKYHKYMFADSKKAVLGSRDMSVGQLQDLITGKNLTDGTITFKAPDGNTVTVRLNDFEDTPAGRLATRATVDAPLDAANVQATLDWGLDRAEWDKRRTVRFVPPQRGFKTIDAADALLMFKNLVPAQ